MKYKKVRALLERIRARGHKEYKYLYQRMLDMEVIRKAYKKLRKGKTKRKEIQYIDEHLDEESEKMRDMIKNTRPPREKVEHPERAYKPAKRKPKWIFEHGKWRKIYMPLIQEQWLHHIVILVLEPIIMATSYKYSCGSFPGRGAHYGKRQIERWLKKDTKGTRNFAKVDIRHFYDNIRLKVLMRELSIRIKDDWFLYVIERCLAGFKKGIPLGFYLSQWLANYLLEPLDKFITGDMGIKKYVRYMDDIMFFLPNKKKLHIAVRRIKMFLGRRFRLKLKRNDQVCKFAYEKGEKTIGRALDMMGFVFFRSRTLMRKHILTDATRLAKRMHRAKEAMRGYYKKHIQGMLSYMGWFTATDTYKCYESRIKPFVCIKKLKMILSKLKRRENKDEGLERRALVGGAGPAADDRGRPVYGAA